MSQEKSSIRRVRLIETSKGLTTDELIHAAKHPETIENGPALYDVLRQMAERLEICVNCGHCYNVRDKQEADAAAKKFEPGRFEGKVGPDGKFRYSRCLNCGGHLTMQAHVWASIGCCELYPYELEVNDRGQPTGYYIDHNGNRVAPELQDGHD